MKLLYVIEHISTVGGLERILVEKINALSVDPAFEVTLLTVWHDEALPAFPLDARVGQACLGVPRPTSAIGMALAMPRVLYRFNRYVHSLRPDVVVHFRAIGAVLAAFSSWRGYTIFESHGARFYNNHTWLYPFMERRVDAVVCLTQGDAANYWRAKRVEVIPNFTTIVPPPTQRDSETTCQPERNEVKSKDLNLPTPPPLLFVGRLCDQKNPLRLLTLWHDIVSLNPALHLDIYGDGELSPQVREEIVRLGLSDSVTMHVHSSDMPFVYASHSLLLLSSVYEGMPMVIIEAMRCGLPVVSLDCPYGPADIIEHGVTGILVSQKDDAGFVKAVLTLMDDNALRQEMGRKAMEVSTQYTPDAVVQRWKELFNEYLVMSNE